MFILCNECHSCVDLGEHPPSPPPPQKAVKFKGAFYDINICTSYRVTFV